MTMPEYLNDPVVKYYISAALAAVPMARVFMRAGVKVWFTASLAVPFFGFIFCLALLARLRWKES